MLQRQRLRRASSGTSRAILLALLTAGSAASVRAQGNSPAKTAPPDSAAPEAPVTAAAVEAAGVKLLGVFDGATGEWIRGATVRDTLGNQVVTSAIGVAALNVLRPLASEYMLEIRKEGYTPSRVKLRVDTATEYLVALDPNPLGGAMLPTTVVTAETKLIADAGQKEGFIYRCGTGLLACVGRTVLDEHKTGYLDNFLSGVDGIQRDCSAVMARPELAGRNVGSPAPTVSPGAAAASGSCPVRMHSIAGNGLSSLCAPRFFVDGFPWSELGADAQADLDQLLSAATIDGMEVYLPGRPVPKRFDAAPSDCGSVVIWTRGTKIPPLKHLPPRVVGDTARKG